MLEGVRRPKIIKTGEVRGAGRGSNGSRRSEDSSCCQHSCKQCAQRVGDTCGRVRNTNKALLNVLFHMNKIPSYTYTYAQHASVR